MEAVFVLISSPSMLGRISMFASIKNLFTHLMDSQGGLLYLSSKVEVVNGIISILTQNPVSILFIEIVLVI